MTKQQIVLLVLGILLAIFVIALIIVSVKLHKISKAAEAEEKHADKVKVVKGVRYSEEAAISDGDGMNISHSKGDFILVKNEVYRAKRGGELMPGVYTALSTNGSDRSFKLRIGGLVKNFVHGDEIVLGEGETISAVSGSVILR